MTRLLTPIAIAVTVAALLSVSVPHAQACSCAQIRGDHQIRDTIDYYDLVVLGAIGTPLPEDSRPSSLHVDVETVYKGPLVSRIALDQPADKAETSGAYDDGLANVGPNCSFSLLGEPGERYLLFLSQTESDIYAASGCASIALGWTATDEYYQELSEGVERVTEGGADIAQPPSPSQSGTNVPWLAIGLSAGLLLAASVILVRRRIIGGG